MLLTQAAVFAMWLGLLMGTPESNAKTPVAEPPFEYFRNPWQVVGLKDYEHGTRISPDGILQLSAGAQVRLRLGPEARPISAQDTKTLLHGWLPILVTTADEEGVRYQIHYFATPLTTVNDWNAAFCWPSEGEDFLTWILVQMRPLGSGAAPGVVRVEFWDGQKSDSKEFCQDLSGDKLAGAAWSITYLDPQGLQPQEIPTAELWLERMVQFWTKLLQSGTQFELPCRKTTEALRAACVCQFLVSDHGRLHGGEGFYDEFYIRDGAYQLMQLEEAGFWDSAARAVEHFLKAQREDGRFETQKGQLDANGQAVWALWQYYLMTRDKAFLERAYPAMKRAVQWTAKARRLEPQDSPFVGLLPPAVADGEYLWDGKHRIVGYDFWNLRGILCTAAAAEALGYQEEAKRLTLEAEDYRQALDAAWRRLGLEYFPPSWEKAGTHWGNTETLWPTPLFEPFDPRVSALIRHVRTQYGGGYHEGTIRWIGHREAIHPYMGAYTTTAMLRRNDREAVVEDFFWYLLHSSSTHAFPEGIYPEKRWAWSNTIPHPTGAANFFLMLRHMLIDERHDELHLLAAVPDQWLSPGEVIRVLNAPTHFGPVTLEIRGENTGLSGTIRADWREPMPTKVVLYVPEDKPWHGQVVMNRAVPVEVVARARQKTLCDFAGMVSRYLQNAPPREGPRIEGWLALPVLPPLKAEQCRFLDLRPVANTDPFTAPFAVPNPGKFIFGELKTGQQVVAGVPFEIIDPRANQGRGLVVLHSPNAPTQAALPQQVEIPVGFRGQRIYFLGHVVGWSAEDRGAGPLGAVAESVIVYEDGSRQIVPWILGESADDWAASPDAQQVWVGLRGNPWHLNVLGVKLRPVVIRKLVFRDLDTVSAPLLAAVTIEN